MSNDLSQLFTLRGCWERIAELEAEFAAEKKRVDELEAARDHLLGVIGYLHDKIGDLASRNGAA